MKFCQPQNTVNEVIVLFMGTKGITMENIKILKLMIFARSVINMFARTTSSVSYSEQYLVLLFFCLFVCLFENLLISDIFL